ncbi:hypothetical protein KCU95_g12220, partial [Aureobasidium melanogenum]
MLVPRVILFWLLALYVPLASTAYSGHYFTLHLRQRPAQLHIYQHKNHQQHMSVQDAIEWASPESLPEAAYTFLSSRHIDNRILTYGSPRTNSTQLIHASDGLWSELSRPAHNQGENLNDGLISGITGLVLAKAGEEEECPTWFDTLDCEDCGGPEHTWEVNPWHFHCKGIEEDGYKWKDCYCMNPDPRRGPCTFDNRADEIREDDAAIQESLDYPGTNEELEEISIEHEHNDAMNAPDEQEECPSGADTLDCEDCGGPEQSWETSPNRFHCKGIEEENFKWKDCYCLNWENARGPCTFDYDPSDTSNNGSALEEELPNPTTETRNLSEVSTEHQNIDATNYHMAMTVRLAMTLLIVKIVVDLNRPGRQEEMTTIAEASKQKIIDGKTATVSTGKMIMDPADYFTSGVTEALKEEQPFTTWYTIQSVSTACHIDSTLNRPILIVQ